MMDQPPICHEPACPPQASTAPQPIPSSPSPPSSPAIGAALEPALHKTCDGRLSPARWFRTDWQRGGALTAYADYTDDHGSEQPVVIKFPVTPTEVLWLTRLQDSPDLVPTVYAYGLTLGGYDIAWVVMERLPHGPLGSAWGGKEFDLLIEAAGRFYVAAANHSTDDVTTRKKDWQAILDQARDNVQRHGLAQEQRWSRALKRTQRKLKDWLTIWNDRPTDQYCHGDLHLANAMSRVPPKAGPALLIDFALTHPGHWVEDAIYFEHLYWAQRDRLEGRKICKLFAKQRKTLGLPVKPDWPRLASVKRALLAMSTPAMLQHDGNPAHVRAALQVLVTELDRK